MPTTSDTDLEDPCRGAAWASRRGVTSLKVLKVHQTELQVVGTGGKLGKKPDHKAVRITLRFSDTRSGQRPLLAMTRDGLALTASRA